MSYFKNNSADDTDNTNAANNAEAPTSRRPLKITPLDCTAASRKLMIVKVPQTLANVWLQCDLGLTIAEDVPPVTIPGKEKDKEKEPKIKVVKAIAPNSIAHNCGKIQLGDELVAIDGKLVAIYSVERIQSMLLGHVGQAIELKFVRRIANTQVNMGRTESSQLFTRFEYNAVLMYSTGSTRREIGELIMSGGGDPMQQHQIHSMPPGPAATLAIHAHMSDAKIDEKFSLRSATDWPKMQVFCEEVQDEEEDEEKEEIGKGYKLLGQVVDRLDLQLPMKRASMHTHSAFKKERFEREKTTLKTVDLREDAVRSDDLFVGSKTANKSKESLDEDGIKKKLFEMMEVKPAWTLREMVTTMNVVENVLKPVLDKHCDHHRQGPLKAGYTLKEVYASAKMKVAVEEEKKRREIESKRKEEERIAYMG